MINFEEVKSEIQKDLEGLELVQNQSYCGSGIQLNGHVYYFEESKDALFVRFALNCQMGIINNLKLKYEDLYGESFKFERDKIGTLNDITFKFFK